MNDNELKEFEYLLTTHKDDWVLVSTEYEYAIINKKTQSILIIDDEELDSAVINKMLESGNTIYEDLNKAYEDL